MKLAILIPEGYDLACLRKARLLAEAVQTGFNLRGASVSVAFGLPQPVESLWRRDEATLTKDLKNAVARHLVWERVPSSNVARMFPWNRRHVPQGLEAVSIPRDWGTNFVDCDIWFNLANPAMGGVFTHRPTAHFCADLSVREYPYSYANDYADPRWEAQTGAFQLWRSDALVVAGDDYTARDLTSFAGVHPDKVMLVPGLTPTPDMAATPQARRSASRILWRVEPTQAFDLHHALKGLGIYLDEGGTLEVRILSESGPTAFDENADVDADEDAETDADAEVDAADAKAQAEADAARARAKAEARAKAKAKAMAYLPPDSSELLRSLPIEHITSDVDLAFQLAQGVGLWSTRIAGGEASALAEGLAAQLPLLAVDTPLHRDWRQRVGTNLILYPPASAMALADALHTFETLCRNSDREPYVRSGAHEKALIAQRVGFVIDRLMELCDD